MKAHGGGCEARKWRRIGLVWKAAWAAKVEIFFLGFKFFVCVCKAPNT